MIKSEMRDEVDTLLKIAIMLVDRLTVLREELHNRKPVTRGDPVSLPMTDERRTMIQRLHSAYPTMSQHEIAKIVGTNQGRVSEVLHGVRK